MPHDEVLRFHRRRLLQGGLGLAGVGLLAGCGLAVELRPPVRGLRVRAVRLQVRLALAAVEDVVARVVDERHTERSDVRRPADVDGGRRLRLVLGTVDVRPGGGVENDIRQLEPVRRRQLDVPVRPGQPDDGFLAKLLAERAAELAALHEELSAYPGGLDPSPPDGIAVPLRIRHGEEELAFLSTVTTFGTAIDITVAELSIEAFLPADGATARTVAALLPPAEPVST